MATPLAYLAMANVLPEDWAAPLFERVQVIGRSVKADIRVSSSFKHVSRLHAEFTGEKGRIWMRDLGSRAGSQTNGVWLEPKRRAQLRSGDRLWIGGLELMMMDALPMLAQVLAEGGRRMVPPPWIDPERSSGASGSTIHLTDSAPVPTMAHGRETLRSLSQAEMEVVLWICRGFFGDAEIGKALFRSPNTVRTQVGSILRKLGINSRAEIISVVKRKSISE